MIDARIELPAIPELEERLLARIQAMPPKVRASFLGALDVTEQYPRVPNERVAVLNDRHDVHIVKPARGVPYAVLGCVSGGSRVVLAAIPRRRPKPKTAAVQVGRALGETVRSVAIVTG